MAKFNYPKNNFSIGEISPRLHGRSDTPTYQNGADTLTNAIIYIGGGVTRRSGTKYLGALKNASHDARIVPFQTGTTTCFLEFGNLYIRVWINGAYNGTEIVSPYAIADVHSLSITRDGNSLYIAHSGYQPRKLVYTNATTWDFTTVDVPAFLRIDGTEHITITPSAITGDITLTASAALFSSEWVGRVVKLNGGYVTITAYTSATVVKGYVAFHTFHDGIITKRVDINTNIPGKYSIEVSTVTSSATKKMETEIAVVPYVNEIKRFVEYSNTDSGQLSSATILYSASEPHGIVSVYIKTVLDTYSKTMVSSTTTISPNSPANAEIFYSTTNVFPLVDTTSDYHWTVKIDSLFGYPTAVAIHEQRLWFGGFASALTTVVSSKIGDLEDFTASELADASCIFKLSGIDCSAIKHLVSNKNLEVYTATNEVTIEGGDAGIKPDDSKVKQRTVFGSSDVQPLQVEADTFFVVRSGKALRQNIYTGTTGQYDTADITALAEHITEAGIKNMAYDRHKRVLYIVLNDGTLCTVSIDKKQGLMGFCTHTTASGIFKSVVSVPATSGDAIYFTVMRNNVMVVEQLVADTNTDSHITATAGSPTTSWSGLSHLNGLTVDVIGDGNVLPQKTVSGGAITTEYAVSTVEIGLPYTCTIVDLPVDVQGGQLQGNHISVNEVSLRVLDSGVFKLNDQVINPRNFTFTLGTNTPITSGLVDIHITQGWTTGGQVTITQDKPIPLTVLGIYKKVSSND